MREKIEWMANEGSSTEEDDDDERREAAIASTPSLQPNFKPKGLTQDQLSKFQELHKRRLQIKSRSKITEKTKGSFFYIGSIVIPFAGGLGILSKIIVGTADGTGKSHRKYQNSKDYADKAGESTLSNLDSQDGKKSTPLQPDNIATSFSSKKRQKLHWGLDTKERWERKANM